MPPSALEATEDESRIFNGPIPDIPLVEAGEDETGDQIPAACRQRSMSVEALKAEAVSPQHLMSHFPHNPYCEVCIEAHMKQRRFARTSERDDDMLGKVCEPCQRLSTDTIIVARSVGAPTKQASDRGHTTIHTIRDAWSGMFHAVPLKPSSPDYPTWMKNRDNFQFFTKPGDYPDVMVKTDNAKGVDCCNQRHQDAPGHYIAKQVAAQCQP